jgi:hypothetical protein
MRTTFILACAVCIMAACGPKKNQAEITDEQIQPETAEVELLKGEDGFWGERFDTEGAMSLEQAVAAMQSADSAMVKVTAPIGGVCQVKGCWLTLGDDSLSVRVKFKDYAFFVPMDCAGKAAVANGTIKREVVSVAEQKHLLEDAKATKEEIDAVTQDEVKLTFMASGVHIQ